VLRSTVWRGPRISVVAEVAAAESRINPEMLRPDHSRADRLGEVDAGGRDRTTAAGHAGRRGGERRLSRGLGRRGDRPWVDTERSEQPLGGATLAATTSTDSLFGTAGSLTSHGFVVHAGGQAFSVRVNSGHQLRRAVGYLPLARKRARRPHRRRARSQNSRAVVVASEVSFTEERAASRARRSRRAAVITQLTGSGFMLATSSGSFWVKLGASTLYFENGTIRRPRPTSPPA